MHLRRVDQTNASASGAHSDFQKALLADGGRMIQHWRKSLKHGAVTTTWYQPVAVSGSEGPALLADWCGGD